MIKLTDILDQIILEVALVGDAGAAGKSFEKVLVRALELVGMKFDSNSSTGALWDIRPNGPKWINMLNDTNVNIKIARTKWMWGTSKLGAGIPWDDVGDDWEEKESLYITHIKRFINKNGVADVVYLKPVSGEIQSAITQAVADEDVPALESLLVNKNFVAEKLGKSYTVRILTKDNRVTSIVIDKAGKPFMRSERPRQMGTTWFVGFRAARVKLGPPRNIKVKV